MFDANNISARRYVTYQVLMPAGLLQNYCGTIQTPNTFEKQEWHTLLSKNIHKNIFSLKSTEK